MLEVFKRSENIHFVSFELVHIGSITFRYVKREKTADDNNVIDLVQLQSLI
jgi:hypothetical protein